MLNMRARLQNHERERVVAPNTGQRRTAKPLIADR
jgi:hypothetical protein